MRLRSALGFFQLPTAGFGLLLALGSGYQLLTVAEPAGGDDIAAGIAIIFLYATALLGVVIASLGLAIPPADGFGVRFSRWQRRLFLGAAATAVLSALAPFLAWSVLASTGFGANIVVGTWLALTAGSAVALIGGLCWRAAEEVGLRISN